MLGRNHAQLSILTAFLIVSPFLLDFQPVIYPVGFMVLVAIGAGAPDADIGGFQPGKSSLAKLATRYLVYLPSVKLMPWLAEKGKIDKSFKKVKGKHRGILHSLPGIAIISIVLGLAIILGSLAFKRFDPWLFPIATGGFALGGFLHCVQDSCTVSGINWKFPYGKFKLEGKLRTFRGGGKVPRKFSGVLAAASVGILTGKEMGYVSLPNLGWLGLTLVTSIVLWVGFMVYCGIRKEE